MSESTPASEFNNDSSSFRTTRWTRVLAARGDTDSAKAALSELCEAYYAPVHAFLRHSGAGNAARDLTHAFFARLLESDGLATIEPDRGKFRSYLLGAVKHFVADQRDRSRAEKRGGGVPDASLDEDSSGSYKVVAESSPAPDSLYDREWAMAVLRRAIDQLATEQQQAGRERQFEILKPWLNGDAGTLSQTIAAAELGISQNVLRVAIHRLRKRFGEAVRNEIAQTVQSPEEIGSELNYLIEVLSSGD